MFSFTALNFVSFASQISVIIGTDGIIPLIASFVIMYIFGILLAKTMSVNKEKSFYDILTMHLGKFVGSILYIIYCISVMYLYSYAVRIICSQVNIYMMKKMAVPAIEIIFIAATVYAASKGFYAMASFGKILSYPIFFILFLLFCLCAGEMDIYNMLPAFTHRPQSYLNAIMHLVSYNFSGVFIIPFAIRYVEDYDERSFRKDLFFAFAAVLAIFIAYYILCIGVLGVNTCSKVVFPAINIMHNRTSSGIFLNRYEIIIVFTVIILYFLYCSAMLRCAHEGFSEITSSAASLIICAIIAGAFIFIFNDRSAGEYLARILHMQGYFSYIVFTFIPVLLWTGRRKENEKSI